MRVVAGAATDKGQVREGNEDAYVVDPRLRLFAIADGMGGHQGGEVASATALEALRAAIASGTSVREAIDRANTAVFDKAEGDEELTGMGTTLTALLTSAPDVTIGHIGDSRAYLLRAGELRQVTEDHSLVEELVREGRITEEQAAVHPQRSIITRALGVERNVEPDVQVMALQIADRVLICSDGLTDMLRNSEIAAVMRRETEPTLCANALVDAANAAGGVDNITAVVVDVVADDDAVDPAATTATIPSDDAGAPPERAEAAGADAVEPVPAPVPTPDAGTPRSRRERRAEARAGRHVGRTTARVLWFAVPIVLILGLGVAAITWYARRTYFVAFDGADRVVVYQGRPGGLLIWDPTVLKSTHLGRGELPEQAQLAIAGSKEFSNRGDAVAYVARLERRASDATTTTTTTITPTTLPVPSGVPAPATTPGSTP